jgi:hypothetical protein
MTESASHSLASASRSLASASPASRSLAPASPADMTLKQVYQNTLQTAIDVIEDTSQAISTKPFITSQEFRDKLVRIYTEPKRRFYVGIWLIVFAFFLYFIDSAA